MVSRKQIRYVIDCASLNRYFWFSLPDGARNFDSRRADAIAIHGQQVIDDSRRVFEELLETEKIISHTEVWEEIKNARCTPWTRWALQKRRLFKNYKSGQMLTIYEMSEEDSEFLAQEKPGRNKHADPWLLSTAKDAEAILITDDGYLREVAQKYGVETISFWDLAETEGRINPPLPTLFDA